jgi:hypothetical protein
MRTGLTEARAESLSGRRPRARHVVPRRGTHGVCGNGDDVEALALDGKRLEHVADWRAFAGSAVDVHDHPRVTGAKALRRQIPRYDGKTVLSKSFHHRLPFAEPSA